MPAVIDRSTFCLQLRTTVSCLSQLTVHINKLVVFSKTLKGAELELKTFFMFKVNNTNSLVVPFQSFPTIFIGLVIASMVERSLRKPY